MYFATVNAENAYDFATAQMEWLPSQGRFLFYLIAHDGQPFHDADDPEDFLRSFEQLVQWVYPYVDWDSPNTLAALTSVESDRKRDLYESDPRISRAISRLASAP